MNSVFDLEQRIAWHREQLMGEATNQRLADQVRQTGRRGPRVRARIATALYALAAWLDSSAVSVPVSVPSRTAHSLPMNGTCC